MIWLVSCCMLTNMRRLWKGGERMDWGTIILGAAMILGEILGGGDDD